MTLVGIWESKMCGVLRIYGGGDFFSFDMRETRAEGAVVRMYRKRREREWQER